MHEEGRDIDWRREAYALYTEGRFQAEGAKRDFEAALRKLDSAYDKMAASYGTLAAVFCGVDPQGFLEALEREERLLASEHEGITSGMVGDPRGITMSGPGKRARRNPK